jgi:3-oxoacyl-[acyl-carrier-protein] synthase III
VASFSVPDIRLRAVVGAVPDNEVHNESLEVLAGEQGLDFIRLVGIERRRVAPPGLCASDLCVAAARMIMEQLAVDPQTIEALVFVTETPDYPLPGNSGLVQKELRIPSFAYLLDVNQGCAGFVYGLATLAAIMNSTGINRGLLLAGDTMTKLVSPSDRSTLPIFSDGGSAVLVERILGSPQIYFHLGSDGEGADAIQVRGGGARAPWNHIPEPAGEGRDAHLSMTGMDVLRYTLQYVPDNVRELLVFAGCGLATPDYYLFHQANQILNGSLVRKLGVDPCKVPQSLLDYGNTGCASIPITMCARLSSELGQASKKLLLSGFGAGFSWGSALIQTESLFCPPLLEIRDCCAAGA